jgi:hypothetical protein
VKIIVCGGRDFTGHAIVEHVLSRLSPTLVAHGGARGADALAAAWAEANGVAHQRFAADWDAYGEAAGPVRNARMLKDVAPDVVVAFPGNRGTQDMLQRAIRAGVKTLELRHGAFRSTADDNPKATTWDEAVEHDAWWTAKCASVGVPRTSTIAMPVDEVPSRFDANTWWHVICTNYATAQDTPNLAVTP